MTSYLRYKIKLRELSYLRYIKVTFDYNKARFMFKLKEKQGKQLIPLRICIYK